MSLLLQALCRFKQRSWRTIVKVLRLLIKLVLSNQGVAESLRFVLFGTLVELGRLIGQKVVSMLASPQGVLREGDPSYDWVNSYLRSQDILVRPTDVTVSTNGADAPHLTEPGAIAMADAEPNTGHWFTWRKHWIRVEFVPGYQVRVALSVTSPSMPIRSKTGGHIKLLMPSTTTRRLEEFLEAAKTAYSKTAISQLTIRVGDKFGDWGYEIKRLLLSDTTEFLASEGWYASAGVPYRRGYLLHGAPGTGKSTTVHALATELGLEVFCLSLAGEGQDDYTLSRLVNCSPPRSILLIEDIDCAFPSRKGDADVETHPPRPKVTLGGLLNVLDSVAGQEGRLVFATTNHVERLDPALIRPGRIDVKLQQMFLRFYPLPEASASSVCYLSASGSPLTAPELAALATQFSVVVPSGSLSPAELQGYLLGWKKDPVRALAEVGGWIARKEAEEREGACIAREEAEAEVDDMNPNLNEKHDGLRIFTLPVSIAHRLARILAGHQD
ncbi:P-loop containing nucleoside triphosphate hydrolase protein [Mycena vitilis]|nr:P-loop containing nucleoside triphosphate hydrolase protein [Mycena vitilis]